MAGLRVRWFLPVRVEPGSAAAKKLAAPAHGSALLLAPPGADAAKRPGGFAAAQLVAADPVAAKASGASAAKVRLDGSAEMRVVAVAALVRLGATPAELVPGLAAKPEAVREEVAKAVRATPPEVVTLALLDALAGPARVVPYVFGPEFYRTRIDYHTRAGRFDSGFMRDCGGKTVTVIDHGRKRRTGCLVADPKLRRTAHDCIRQRLLPEIRKAVPFEVTRIGWTLVACYDAATDGYFRAHRDDITKGAAHRRFAVALNPNAEEYEGGNLWFLEFGRRAYRPPTGGACVFSCPPLHEATSVTRGSGTLPSRF